MQRALVISELWRSLADAPDLEVRLQVAAWAEAQGLLSERPCPRPPCMCGVLHVTICKCTAPIAIHGDT